jgi:hypothetical protein
MGSNPSRVALQVDELNRTEAQRHKQTVLLGARCPDPNSDTTLAFCSFVPNALSRSVIGENLVSQRANRSLFAVELLGGG